MAAEQHSHDEPPPLVPPTQAGDLPPLERSTTWPRTLGIVAIIFGSFAALGGLLSASVPLLEQAIRMSVADKDAVNWDAVRQVLTWISWISLASVPVAILLLVAGIGLIRRRAWAVPAARVWAVIKIGMVVLGTAVNVVVQRNLAEALQQAGTTAQGPGIGISPIGILWSLAWGWALPIFVLIWLARAEIREETARWK